MWNTKKRKTLNDNKTKSVLLNPDFSFADPSLLSDGAGSRWGQAPSVIGGPRHHHYYGRQRQPTCLLSGQPQSSAAGTTTWKFCYAYSQKVCRHFWWNMEYLMFIQLIAESWKIWLCRYSIIHVIVILMLSKTVLNFFCVVFGVGHHMLAAVHFVHMMHPLCCRHERTSSAYTLHSALSYKRMFLKSTQVLERSIRAWNKKDTKILCTLSWCKSS